MSFNACMGHAGLDIYPIAFRVAKGIGVIARHRESEFWPNSCTRDHTFRHSSPQYKRDEMKEMSWTRKGKTGVGKCNGSFTLHACTYILLTVTSAYCYLKTPATAISRKLNEDFALSCKLTTNKKKAHHTGFGLKSLNRKKFP